MHYHKITLLTWLLFSAGCGGGGSSSPPINSQPPPSPPPAAPALEATRIFGALTFTDPVAMRQAPGDATRWYVVEQAGVIRSFDNDPAASTSSVFVDLTTRVNDNSSEAGLLSLAFHPDYPTTPEVFVLYTATGAPLITTISRFYLDGTNLSLDPGSEEILLQVPQPQTNHNGGDLAFGPAGYLYASFGDGGGAGDPGENGQNTQNLLGTIVRLDVDGGSPYAIPNDNPFSGNTLCTTGPGGDNCPEIFAWGFRNPWRISVDSQTGSLWAGDVGQADWEEVNLVTLGSNYGWNDREGAHCFDPPSNCADTFAEPITEYDHNTGQSITGGYVYRGTVITELVGWYVFGDFISGELLAVEATSPATTAPASVGNAGIRISSFARDTQGELYLLNYAAGTVYQLQAAP